MGLMVGAKQRGGKRDRGPTSKKPGPAQNHPKDAQADAAVVASGAPLRTRKRKVPGPHVSHAEAMLAAIDEELAADPTLIHRPQVRWMLRFLGVEQVKNLDGTPVTMNGAPLAGTMRENLLRHGLLQALDRNDPHAFEYWQEMMRITFGEPRKAMELTGPAGMPLPAVVAPPWNGMSDEELAAKFARALRITRRILDDVPREIEGIPVAAQEATTQPETAPQGAQALEVIPIPQPAPEASQARPVAMADGRPRVGNIRVAR